jgi:hypothetical protein
LEIIPGKIENKPSPSKKKAAKEDKMGKTKGWEVILVKYDGKVVIAVTTEGTSFEEGKTVVAEPSSLLYYKAHTFGENGGKSAIVLTPVIDHAKMFNSIEEAENVHDAFTRKQ